MKLELGQGWAKKLKGRVEKYNFEAGILSDKPHKEPIQHGVFESPQLTNYAGGPARKLSRNISDKSTADILVANSERLNIDLLRDPLKDESSDINKFTTAFLKYVTTEKNIKRVENLLQAVIRNPILRGDYGTNSGATARFKGFNRHLIDTGQMFKSIMVKAKRGK